jgi:hypothetical protein
MEPLGIDKIYQIGRKWILIWRKDGQQKQAKSLRNDPLHFQVSGDIVKHPALA